MKLDDITPDIIPSISWEADKRKDSINALYEYVMTQSKRTREWYRLKKGPKRLRGKIYRIAALLLTSVGGALPIISELCEQYFSVAIDPIWTSVLLGLAGLFVVFDRFGDHSAGWIRYMHAQQQISALEEKFRFTWHSCQIVLMEDDLTVEETQELLQMLNEFTHSVQSVVKSETDEWAQNFESFLNDSGGNDR